MFALIQLDSMLVSEKRKNLETDIMASATVLAARIAQPDNEPRPCWIKTDERVRRATPKETPKETPQKREHDKKLEVRHQKSDVSAFDAIAASSVCTPPHGTSICRDDGDIHLTSDF